MRCSSRGRGARCFTRHGRQVLASRLERRDQAHHDRRHRRECEREHQNPDVEMDLGAAREACRAGSATAASAPRAPPARRRARRRRAPRACLPSCSRRMTRARLAPSASRVAISWRRASARINRRLATLAHAMSSTKATAPLKMRRDVPNVADDGILSGITRAADPSSGEPCDCALNEGLERGLRLLPADTRLEPADHRTAEAQIAIEANRRAASRSRFFRGYEKPGRQDADDGVRLAVERDPAIQRARDQRRTVRATAHRSPTRRARFHPERPRTRTSARPPD